VTGLADSENLPQFSHRLRLALRGHNRLEVCAAIGKSRRAMTGWLNGSNQPLAGTLAALCEVLNVSPSWLLGFTTMRRPLRRGVTSG